MSLYLNHDADLGWLIAMPFGEVSDEALADEIDVGDAFRYVARQGEGGIVGFVVRPFSSFDPEAAAVTRIWREPAFDAPQLGLRNVSAGEICLAARPFLGGRSTVNGTASPRRSPPGARKRPPAGGFSACRQVT